MSDITELDVSTGQEVSRKYTKAEKDAIASIVVDGKEEIEAMLVEIEEKKALIENAILALQELGLTEAQARAISGL
jgi:hypothetical protein